jgi:hypothetical protein
VNKNKLPTIVGQAAVCADRMRSQQAHGFTSPSSGTRLLALLGSTLFAGAANAIPYDPGLLSFATTDPQSMWGPGDAPILEDSMFFGSEWTNKSATLGGIVGSVSTTTVNTNPLWWVWKGCKETVNVFCGSEPDPGDVRVVTDTRTGAKLDLTSSGKMGFELGYTVDSGSVLASLDYSASAVLPDTLAPGDFFSLGAGSSLDDGEISSQSPTAKAYINAIAELSASVTATGCLIFAGCTSGTGTLIDIDETLPLLEINPNALEVLPRLLPDLSGEPHQAPLASVDLFGQTLTLEGALDATLTPGFKLSSSQFTLVDTTPPTPDLTVELASLSVNVPEIQTLGGVDGDVLTSNGRDDLAKLKIDLDGVAAMGGAIPPLGVGIDLIDIGSGATNFKVSTQLDLLDIDAGPDLGITQNFELTPTLMVRLDFDKAVTIEGMAAPQLFWEGEWSDLPRMALSQGTTTFTPTFWLDAILTNNIGLDLGLSGTIDLFKFSFGASLGGVNLLGTSPVSLNSLLGVGNTLFETPKAMFPIWDTSFHLGGFDRITAASFGITTVPTPGVLWLMMAGFGALLLPRLRRTKVR